MTEYAFEGAKRSSTAITWSFAALNYTADAATPFSRTISAAYQSIIAAAFDRWSSVSALTFTQVSDSANVAIRVGFGIFTGSVELGETDYRFDSGVLANDTLIRLLDPLITPLSLVSNGIAYSQYNATLYQVTLHEIGHAIGLDHTTDPQTIMYPYASPLAQDLAAGDIQGVNALYPLFDVVASNPIQNEGGPGTVDTFNFVVTRHSDPSVPLTINYNVVGMSDPAVAGSVAAGSGAFAGGVLPSGQLTFAAGSTTATLSIVAAGNSLPQPDQGFGITFSTGNPSDIVTTRGTVTAAILDDDGYGQVSGDMLGVYRFFDTSDGTHFYSTSQTERNTLIQTRPDLVYEGVGLSALAIPGNDPAAAPVFRFFDTSTGTHFYTASASESATIAQTRPDLIAEGIGFYEHSSAQAGDIPVFRFFDTSNGTHFYTSSAAERSSILLTRPDLTNEGVAFYAPTS